MGWLTAAQADAARRTKELIEARKAPERVAKEAEEAEKPVDTVEEDSEKVLER